MGYRSDVTLTIFENDYQELIRLAKQQDNLDYLKGCQLYRASSGEDNIVTLFWSWVKWYEGYEDVSFIESFMRSGIQYNFKRVGEETGDVEEESNDDDWILGESTCVVTEISLDNAGEEMDLDSYLNSVSDVYNDNIEDDDVKDVKADDLLAIINS